MATRHPFAWLSASRQKHAFIALLALTIAVMVGLNALGRPLNTEAAPSGIISFELAGKLSVAQRMVESWGQTGQVYAGLNLGLDYLFMVAYSSCISLGCVLVARSFSPRVGLLLAWAQFGAALLDVMENYALIQVLLGSQQELWPVVARWCAIPKFSIVAAGLVYVGFGVVLGVATKGRR
ncbi:MAG: hypothetical protein FJ014_14425 [Chloroflexi bacterium]|nr:hypothetical protein [Chloroflexota bacterium]